MRKTKPNCFLILLVLLFSSLSATVFAHEEKIIGTKHIFFADGTGEDFFLVRDLDTGEVLSKKVYEIPLLVHRTFAIPSTVEIKGLKPYMVFSIPDDIRKLDFSFNTLANQLRERCARNVYELINPLRGTQKKPRIILNDAVIDTDNYTEEQFYDDGINMIYVTEDDKTWDPKFIGAINGMAYTYWDFEKWEFQGCEVSVTYCALQNANDQWYDAMWVHEFGHIFGYRHTGWVEDYMSYVGPWDAANFEWEHFNEYWWDDKDSFVWKTSKLVDRMVYGGKVVNGVYKSDVNILPADGAVIDLKYLLVDSPYRFNSRHAIAMTTLKGYAKKPLTLTIYRGWRKRLEKDRRILKISGYHPLHYLEGYPILENYKVSHLLFDRQSDYEKLEHEVLQYGQPKVFYYTDFAFAMEATIVITGYEARKSKKEKTLITKPWFVIRTQPEQ